MRAPIALLAVALWAPRAFAVDCPRGDAPAFVGEFVVERVQTHVDVVGGAAAVRTEITFRNTGDGPARGAVTLATALDDDAPPPLIVQRAFLMGGGRAALDASEAASERFEAFVDVLENGVDPADARDGARAALLVQETHGGDITVEVAAACSSRVITAVVAGAVLAEPVDGGERYVVPSVGPRDVLVTSTTRGQLWVDGQRPGKGGRVARTVAGHRDDDATDEDFDGVTTRPFVVQVSDIDAGLRFTGQLIDVDPVMAKTKTDSEADDGSAPSPLGEAGFGLLGASLALPRPLSTVPPSLQLVFVVDASVSAGDDGVARALRLMQAVLDAAPADAGWALIAMQREPRLVVPPWQPRDHRFVPRIDVGNGTDVSAALALARRIGSDSDPGAGRIIVLSDLAQKSGDDDALARALVGDAATTPIVHLVELPEDVGPDEALDHTRVLPGETALATAVTSTRGIHVALGPADRDRDHDLALHLLRPTRLDDLRLFVDGRDVSALLEGDSGGDPIDGATLLVRPFVADVDAPRRQDTLPVFLIEGDGLRLAARLPAGTRRAELRALAWADEIRLPLTPLPPKMAPAAIATATNLDLRDLFAGAPDALDVVARRFGFVSAVTSLVSVPTFRPARPEGLGMRGSGSCGCGCCGGIGGVGRATACGWGTGKVLKAQEILDQLARDIARVCRADVDATLEVADLEILDVHARGAGRRCVAARLWRARLDALTPGDGSFESRGTFTIAAPYEPPTGGDHAP